MTSQLRILPGKEAAIFAVQEQGEPVRDEALVETHFPDFPESQLTMLLERCDRDIKYLNEVDLRYMASRITHMLQQLLDQAPPNSHPAQIQVPKQLKSLIPAEPEIMAVKDFISAFKGFA